MGANTLLGNDVYNKDGEDLGDIKEFMIDMASGKVAYAVLSLGGLLGMGDKLFAVPWAALTLDTANKRFTLNVRKVALKGRAGFQQGSLAVDVGQDVGNWCAQILWHALRWRLSRRARRWPRSLFSLNSN
jgi:hypothetical protein